MRNQTTPTGRLQSWLLCFALFSSYLSCCFSISANPNRIFEEVGNDRFLLELKLHGSEEFQWTSDPDGNVVTWNHELQDYVYVSAVDDQGKFVPSEFLVGRSASRDPGEFLGVAEIEIIRQQAQVSEVRSPPKLPAYTSALDTPLKIEGQVRNLVLLMRFGDHVGRELIEPNVIDVLMNGYSDDIGLRAPIVTGSVRDYFSHNSYNKVDVDSRVFDWVTVDVNETEAAAGCSSLCDESVLTTAVLQALERSVEEFNINLFDFDANGDGYVDLLTVIHSGHGAEHGGLDDYITSSEDRIWSHRRTMQSTPFVRGNTTADQFVVSPAFHYSKGNDVLRIGVLVHELAHQFGLPDLYDIDSSSSGIGAHGLMSFAWGRLWDQYYPPPLSAWAKLLLGWAEPKVIESSGDYSLGHARYDNTVFVLRHGFESKMEYLLLEHRHRGSGKDWYDYYLYQDGGGLLVYHIDEAKSSNSEEGIPGSDNWPRSHFRVAIAQVDGEFLLERSTREPGGSGDLMRTGAKLNDETFPSINAYNRRGCGKTGTQIEILSAPGNTADTRTSMVEFNVKLDTSAGSCCTDDSEFELQAGSRGCAWFQEDPTRCASSLDGAVEGVNGETAQEACCACGGGETFRATPSPFALPWVSEATQPPVFTPFQPPSTDEPAQEWSFELVFAVGFGAVIGVSGVVLGGLYVRDQMQVRRYRDEIQQRQLVVFQDLEELQTGWARAGRSRMSSLPEGIAAAYEDTNPRWVPGGVPTVETPGGTKKIKSWRRMPSPMLSLSFGGSSREIDY